MFFLQFFLFYTFGNKYIKNKNSDNFKEFIKYKIISINFATIIIIFYILL